MTTKENNMHPGQLDQALHNIGYHPPKDEETAEALDMIRESFKLQLGTIDPLMPDGREKALCFTHIEEACMYAIAAVVRNQHPESDES